MSDELPTLSDEQLQELFAWVDEFKLSRPKKNFTRDFSDGALTAELLKNFFPKTNKYLFLVVVEGTEI